MLGLKVFKSWNFHLICSAALRARGLGSPCPGMEGNSAFDVNGRCTKHPDIESSTIPIVEHSRNQFCQKDWWLDHRL